MSTVRVENHAEGVRVLTLDRPPANAIDETLLTDLAAGTFPREAYAHAKAALIADALGRIDAETPGEALQTIAVWLTPESRTARARQRQRLKKAGCGQGS